LPSCVDDRSARLRSAWICSADWPRSERLRSAWICSANWPHSERLRSAWFCSANWPRSARLRSAWICSANWPSFCTEPGRSPCATNNPRDMRSRLRTWLPAGSAAPFGDREQFERSQRADDRVDLVSLDELLRFRLGACRAAASVGGYEIHLAATERVILFFQVGDDALLHLDAALRERTGLDGEQAQFEWRRLRDRRCREFEGRRYCASGCTGHKSATGDLARHHIPPFAPLWG